MTDKSDLTSGSITGKLVAISLPIIGTQLMQMAYNLTDMFWLGRLSEDAVAASGAAGMYLWLSVSLMMFGQMGASIGVSQSIGRGDRGAAAGFAGNALALAAVLGVAYMAAMMALRTPLVGFFNIREAHVADMTRNYLLMVAPFVPMSFVSSVMAGCYTAAGDSRTPFFVSCVGLIVNVALDPLLIFGAGWGVEGAAAATVAAQLAATSVFVYIFNFSPNRLFSRVKVFARPDTAKMRQIFMWALPVAAESLLFTFLSMLMSRMIASWGAGALAVSRVGSQVESLTWMIGEGYASAITAYTGQNFGAGKWVRIHKGFSVSLAILCGWGVTVTALMLAFAPQFIGVFLSEPATVAIGTGYLRIMAVCQMFMCLEFVAAGSFRGMGRTLPPSVASISMNVARLALAYFLAGTALGLDGVWWAMCLGAIGRGGMLFVWHWFYKRKLPREDVLDIAEGAAA